MNATANALDRPTISLVGRLRIGARLGSMLLLLIACVPLYYLWRLARLPNPWPRIFLGGIARIAGARIRVTGAKAQGGAFLLSNHVSWLDIPVIAGISGSAFIAHSGLAEIGLLKWLCAMNDTVFVARHDRRTVHAQVELVRAALTDTGALTVFPEGTTSDGHGLLPFKSSLLSALDPVPPGIAIQPLWIDYGPDVASIAWVGEEHGLDNFLKILARRRPVPVTVHFLPPLAADETANRKTMAAAARERIMAAMDSVKAGAR
ncbi:MULTISPECIES: 1-acyl-sn-glycerol-3-phosphate acyltransferase [unclassified Novosphingobium]|uniref:lysophospholipid acyltransferase family protein n=1 Tax=unclassified Novosphingobium TaxID=2644732 RepID=UPI0025FB1856|nr:MULTISPECIES: lysophospholipid acyltransferase family protein [unclassified Novosphingobium]HQS69773.1 lysophospholipid acyltransferase family protein [Novosphingobium sp.]